MIEIVILILLIIINLFIPIYKISYMKRYGKGEIFASFFNIFIVGVLSCFLIIRIVDML
jgi:formate hydrogenlyase subunit 3/multisubunit Na+/H+ antiporter MnhD subunit